MARKNSPRNEEKSDLAVTMAFSGPLAMSRSRDGWDVSEELEAGTDQGQMER